MKNIFVLKITNMATLECSVVIADSYKVVGIFTNLIYAHSKSLIFVIIKLLLMLVFGYISDQVYELLLELL